MARPKKMRRVCKLPEHKRFGPVGCPEHRLIRMTVEEFETVRLIDLEGYTQEECAQQMDVSRTTVQGIYMAARKKLADSLVNGKMIHIEGGDYELYSGPPRTNKRGPHKKHRHGKCGK